MSANWARPRPQRGGYRRPDGRASEYWLPSRQVLMTDDAEDDGVEDDDIASEPDEEEEDS